LNVVEFDQQDVFVHLDGVPDIQALGYSLMLRVDGDSTMMIAAADPDSQSGWAQPATTNGYFLGDSTYDWAIHFPVGHERTKIHYILNSPLQGDTLRGEVWVQNALVQDGQGEVDTLVIGPCARISGVDGPNFAVPTDSLPGLVTVEFEPGAVVPGHEFIFPIDILSEGLRDSLRSLASFSVAKRVFPSAQEADTLRVGVAGDTVRCPDLTRIYVMKVSEFTPVAAHLSGLSGLLGVEHVNPVGALIAHRVPNDPRYSEQWHLAAAGAAAIGAPQAWDVVTGASSLLVAVLDSGLDYHHPEVDPNQDQSRFVRGWDYGDSDDDVYDDTPPDDRGHGTSVGGLIGALTDNAVGVAGVMWQGRVLVHKTADQVGVCPAACFSYHPTTAVAAAIDDASRRGAKVINMSIGFPFQVPGSTLGDILDYVWRLFLNRDPLALSSYAAYRLGSTLVASAGNDGHNWVDMPATFPWVLAVGASDQAGSRYSYSNYGARLDVLAPGSGTLTLAMLDQYSGYTFFSGTSAAAPIASGAAALLLAESEAQSLGLSNEDVTTLLKLGCRDIASTGIGWDEFTGHGHLDVAQSLARLRPPYQVLRGSAQAGTVTLLYDLHQHSFIGPNPLPPQVYYVKTYQVRSHVDFCGPTSELPLAWVRERECLGWSPANPNREQPYAQIENLTTSGFDLVTHVFWVQQDLTGSSTYQGWWPCSPEQASMTYTASIRSPLSSVSIHGPRVDCAGSWNAVTCGGEGGLSYAWYERMPGATWSGVVATTPTYTRYLNDDLELKLEVVSAGVTLSDTQSVTYQPCVVDVQAKTPVTELRLAATPNPGRQGTTFSIDLPHAGRVRLSVYDPLGRLVQRVVDGDLPAGNHRIDWSQRASASPPRAGLYFVRLETPSGVRGSRFVIVR
jgi:subtilisin family serine protease